MTDSIDDLSLRWKRNPDPGSTIALCEALRGSVRSSLVQQVAEFASSKYPSNVPVLLAVARMYMNTHKLAEAQAVLVAAGKIAPRDGGVYRVLGEVLLRRGDADRAEKVFERAVHFGMTDADTKLWVERARVYKSMQVKAGARAVASEVARSAPVDPAAPAREIQDSFGDLDTSVKEVPKDALALATPPPYENDLEDDLDAPTMLRSDARVQPLKPSSLPPPSAPPKPHVRTLAPPPFIEPQMAVPTGPRKYPPNAETAQAFSPQDDPPAPIPPAPRAPRAPAPIPHAPDAPDLNGSAARAEAPYRDPARAAEVPHAQDVLDALALAGVFEPPERGDIEIKWAKPDAKPRRRAAIPLAIMTVLLVGGGFGAHHYVKAQEAKAHLEAEHALDGVEVDLRSSQASLLPDVEQRFSHIFDIDSRSGRAAVDWLHERGLSGLLKGGQDLAFEENITRAREVKVPEDQIAFALIASFLFQGDTAGAASVLPKWDASAAQDPWYQLLAGATLERAGDARAKERYQAATKLDPDLLVAHVGLIRAEAIDGDPVKAMDLAKAFRAKWPDRPEGSALVALAWGRDPGRGEQAPPEVADTIAKAQILPIGLQAVPHALAAILAVDKRDYQKTKDEVKAGLAVVEGPGMATWLGVIALDTGDEDLARKGALAAVQFSAVYPPARVLAARVALLGDRLDEALKATEELDANSPNVAVVRAAAAYERVDSTGLGAALEAVPVEARKLPFLAALTLAQDAMAGKAQMTSDKILDMSDDEAPWSDLVAMDLALDMGDLDSADKIAAKWKGTEAAPLRAARLSRLARYRGRNDDADQLSATAINNGTVTTRSLLERVLALVAKEKAAEVGPLLAKYAAVLGQSNMAWLGAYANASAGKLEDARGKTSQLDPPPSTAPVPVRVIAAIACGAMRDRRRGLDLVKDLLDSGIRSPDVAAAGAAFSLKAPVRRPAKK